MQLTQRLYLTSLCALITLAIGIGFNIYIYSPKSDTSSDTIKPIEQAYINSPTGTSPEKLDEQLWRPMSLPHNWAKFDYQQKQLWYRLEIPDTIDSENLAIYIPTVIHNVEAFVNDTWVGGSSFKNNKLVRHANKPLYFEFSKNLLTSDTNFVYFKLSVALSSQGFIDQVYIGSKARIYPKWKNYYAHRYQLLESITLFMFFCACVLLLFWSSRKKDTQYGFFGITLLLWSTYNLYWLMDHNLLPLKYWEAINIISFGATVVFLVVSNHRGSGVYSQLVEKIFAVYLLLGLLLFLLPSIDTLHWWGYKVWMPITIPLGTYATVHLVYSYYVTGNLDFFFSSFISIIIVSCGLHDVLVLNDMWDRSDGMYCQYLTVPVGLFFSVFLMKNFITSLRTTEDLMHTLEQRVIEKENKLIEKYEQIRSLEQEQLLAKERERMMRDMHDGIGGQLIGVLSSIQNEKGSVFDKIKEKVQFSLNDLRLVIDSLDPTLKDISTLLGVLRYRLQSQLSSSHIQLQWEVDEAPESIVLSPQKILHIMRIIQEATTNSIKHANTPALTIATDLDENNFYIKIIDCGKGFEQKDQHQNGRGINNMSYRAAQAGIQLDIQSTPSGSTVLLSFPLE